MSTISDILEEDYKHKSEGTFYLLRVKQNFYK